MPTYEYHCAKGHVFEEFQSIVAEPVHVCPICGSKAERQISGGTGLIFKGSGFYITDYAHKNNSPASSTHHHHEKKEESKSETSAPQSEPKPESTSADKSRKTSEKP